MELHEKLIEAKVAAAIAAANIPASAIVGAWTTATGGGLKNVESVGTVTTLEISTGIRQYDTAQIPTADVPVSVAIATMESADPTGAAFASAAAAIAAIFQGWLLAWGGQRVILGADVREGKIAVKGWLEETALGVDELVERFLPDGLQECICTDISRDGMLQGPSFDLYPRLQEQFPDVSFTVSGGISSMDDIRRLDGLGLRKVIAGKAIYENRISLKEITQWSLNASSPASM
jgi:phosphoribosylformimino-5-aminoimidazole carboxamide ribonucleotide (ProFAR) isomerase